MTRIEILQEKISNKKGRREQIRSDIDAKSENIQKAKDRLLLLEQSLEIVKQVGLKTQEQLQYHIGDITSLALEAVFNDPYELKIEFVERRNKTECDLYFVRNGEKVNPIDASGGGAVDVASFALRVASWSMQTPHSRNTIILDEPLRFLSEDHQEKASQMIKEVSRKLGIQFIIITHNTLLAQFADKTFKTSLRKKITKLSES